MEPDKLDVEVEKLKERAERLREVVKGHGTNDDLNDLARQVEETADTLASMVRDLRKKRDQ